MTLTTPITWMNKHLEWKKKNQKTVEAREWTMLSYSECQLWRKSVGEGDENENIVARHCYLYPVHAYFIG